MNHVSHEILFDKFEVIEVLKKTGPTAVYLAMHIHLQKMIILKSLNTEKVVNEENTRRFQREAKILARLDHPNIIKVLDFGTADNYFYISFEYFGVSNLRPLIENGKLSDKQKEAVLLQLFKGLDFAHRNDVIHRDVKPENIFLNERMELKIGDFGLAHSLHDDFVSTEFSIVGTPCYMSPEQVQGKKLTTSTDLFSAGIVALELFSGKNPLLGQDINQTFNNVINFSETRLDEELQYVPEHLRPVLHRLLVKEEEERITSAAEVLALLDPKGLEENKQRTKEVAKAGGTKRSTAMIAGTSAAVLIIILLGWWLFSPGLPKPSLTTPAPQDTSAVAAAGEEAKEQPGETQPGDEPPAETGAGTGENNVQTAPEPETSTAGNEETVNTPPPAEEEERLPLQPAPVRYGNLIVECLPWAYVFLDGERMDTTPMDEPLRLPTGSYTLGLIHPDYPPYQKRITVENDQTISITVNLDTLLGSLALQVYPWGEVFIDGQSFGQTPLEQNIKLSPGTYVLTITNPGYEDFQKRITIAADEALTVNYNFEEETAETSTAGEAMK